MFVFTPMLILRPLLRLFKLAALFCRFSGGVLPLTTYISARPCRSLVFFRKKFAAYFKTANICRIFWRLYENRKARRGVGLFKERMFPDQGSLDQGTNSLTEEVR